MNVVAEAESFSKRVAELVTEGMHKDAALKQAWAEALERRHSDDPCRDPSCVELRR